MEIVIRIAIEAALLGLVALLAICAVVGAAVAIRPDAMGRLKRATERRISMRRATRGLDIPRNVDRLFYRHHRLYGGLIVVLAIVLLYALTFGGTAHWETLFDGRYRAVGAIIIDAAQITLWILTVFALIIGTVVFVRPSALKALEQRANRWVTARGYTYPLEREYSGLDERLQHYPRVWGTIVAILSGVCIIALINQWLALGPAA